MIIADKSQSLRWRVLQTHNLDGNYFGNNFAPQQDFRTIWHHRQFDTTENLTPRTIWHRTQFDTGTTAHHSAKKWTPKGRGCAPTCVTPWPLSESISLNHHQSASISINQNQSDSIRINQNPSESTRINQNQSELIRINQHQSESISNQSAIIINQNQSASIRINQH